MDYFNNISESMMKFRELDSETVFEILGQAHYGSIIHVLLTGCFLICCAFFLLQIILKYHKQATFTFITWLLWFFWSMMTGGLNAWTELSDRFSEAFLSTRLFIEALIRMLFSWLGFFLPFLVSIFKISFKLWNHLNWEQRGLLGLTVIFIFGVAKAYQKVVEYQRDIKTMLYQVSFIAAAPLIWYLNYFIPMTYWENILNISLNIIPTIYSIGVCLDLHYYKEGKKKQSSPEAEQKLGLEEMSKVSKSIENNISLLSKSFHLLMRGSRDRRASSFSKTEYREMLYTDARNWVCYWGLWPILNSVILYIVLPYMVTAPDLPRMISIVLIYCQFWGGSKLVIGFIQNFYAYTNWSLRVLINSIRYGYNNDNKNNNNNNNNQSADSSDESDNSSEAADRISSLMTWYEYGKIKYNWVKSHKILTLALLSTFGVVAIYFMYRILGVVSGVLTLLIIWFSGFDCIKTGAEDGLHVIYQQKLSFWIIFQCLAVFAKIPIVGTLLSIWQPLILALALVAGNTTVVYAMKFFKRIFLKKHYRQKNKED